MLISFTRYSGGNWKRRNSLGLWWAEEWMRLENNFDELRCSAVARTLRLDSWINHVVRIANSMRCSAVNSRKRVEVVERLWWRWWFRIGHKSTIEYVATNSMGNLSTFCRHKNENKQMHTTNLVTTVYRISFIDTVRSIWPRHLSFVTSESILCVHCTVGPLIGNLITVRQWMNS